MTEIIFRSDMGVTLVNVAASDESVIRAARVSTGLDMQEILHKERSDGLIRYLMKNRHGTPFEHNMFTFRVECPIAIAREMQRHRIGISFNEESGRYKELDPVFWIPCDERALVQEGKPGHYEMKPGTPEQLSAARQDLRFAATRAYAEYEIMLEDGIAREVARMCLPVNTYTALYMTCNARSLMNFLSLRVDSADAMFPSKPQYEIQQVAREMEEHFRKSMPVTHQAFIEAGRVAP
ncbi:FAD-dependent thymidylate synthase [Bradyrhizobium sp.]